MDPVILTELVKLGPGGLIAALLFLALGVVWRLWRSAEDANKLAAVNLSAQQIVNVKAEGTIENRDAQIKQLEREYARLERELERCNERPPPREGTR